MSHFNLDFARPLVTQRFNSASDSASRRAVLFAWVFALLGIMLSLYGSYSARKDYEEKSAVEFELQFRQVAESIAVQFKTTEEILRGVAGLFKATGEVSPQGFHAYIEGLELGQRYPEVQGIGFVRLESFQPQQECQALAGHARAVVRYIEPDDERNRRAISHDVFAEPIRRRALCHAWESGQPALTAKTSLVVQDRPQDVQPGFVLYFPIYRAVSAGAVSAEPGTDLIGWASSPMRARDMLSAIMARQQQAFIARYDLVIHDGPLISPAAVLYESRAATALTAHSLQAVVKQVEIAGRTWTLTATPRSDLPDSESVRYHQVLLWAGLFITAIVTAFTHFLVRANGHIRVALHNSSEAATALGQKSEKIKTLLDNSNDGFLLFGDDLTVASTYSQACIDLLGVTPEGRSVDELLFPDDLQARTMLRGCVSDALHEADPERCALFLSLIPDQLHQGDRYLKAQYVRIPSGIMVVLTDATKERELAERIEQENRRLEMIVAAVTESTDFFALIREFEQFIEEGAAPWQGRLNALYREVHTYKGSFNQFSFRNTPLALHQAEMALQSALNSPTFQTEAIAEVFGMDWPAFLALDLEVVSSALGSDFLQRGDFIALKSEQITLVEKLAHLHLEQDALDETERRIAHELAQIRSTSLHVELQAYDKLIQRIASLQGKQVVLRIEGSDIRLSQERFRSFFQSLGHVFRNAVDHGIGDEESRFELGKPEVGQILCVSRVERGYLMLEISDDGNGINEAALRDKVGNEFPTISPDADISELVFLDGLSSRLVANEISGRGIGMAAVKQEVERLNGKITLESYSGVGTMVRFSIPFELTRGQPR